MALFIKDTKRPSGSTGRQGVVDQWIQVTQPAVALPATTTGQLFRVKGGRVLMQLLIGQVTTAIQNQANGIIITSKALDNSSVAVGTAVDLSASAASANKEVGAMLVTLGSGAAAIFSNAGAALRTLGAIPTILPQGEVYITTSATNTGAMKWDMWYMPIDPGAFVEPALLSSSLLTAAI